jgi:Na+/phosphate symporter
VNEGLPYALLVGALLTIAGLGSVAIILAIVRLIEWLWFA